MINTVHKRQIAVFTLTAALFCMMLLFMGDTARAAATRAIRLCVSSVIPSVFPFLILASLFVSLGCGDALGTLLGRPLARLFRISPQAVSAVICGALCGFPVGAKTAGDLYLSGRIPRAECERLLCFTNNAGPAFVIGAVGGAMWGDPFFGVALYGLQILLSFCAGMILAIAAKDKEPPVEAQEIHPVADDRSVPAKFCDAVTGASQAMLVIVGFILFFSVLSGVIHHLLSALLPDITSYAIVAAIFEFSQGCSVAASIESLPVAAAVTAFAINWAGLSVHAQTMALLSRCSVSMRPYLLTKAVCGMLAAGTMYLLYPLFAHNSLSAADMPVSLIIRPDSVPTVFFVQTGFLFLVYLIGTFRGKIHKNVN